MARMDNFAEPGCGVRAAGKFITLKALWLLTRDAFFQWIDDNPFRLAAALAYYTLFSMAPLLLIAVAVAGEFWRSDGSIHCHRA
jgi:uncharacterized BrkB/YihY/UPF0761 family membrane protein